MPIALTKVFPVGEILKTFLENDYANKMHASIIFFTKINLTVNSIFHKLKHLLFPFFSSSFTLSALSNLMALESWKTLS